MFRYATGSAWFSDAHFAHIRGHEVPAYKFGNLGTGEAALQMFSHIVSNNPLSAT